MKDKRFIIAICVILSAAILLLVLPRLLSNEVDTPTPSSNLTKKMETTLKSPFQAKATIRLQELTLTADLNKTATGQATFSITEPPSLSGMSFVYSDSGITVMYKGISVTLDENSKLAKTALATVVAAIDKAAAPGGVSVSLESSALKLSGKTEQSSFSIFLDRENGSIASLSLPELDLECEFDDFLVSK